jgi:hypothetical protein
MSRAADGYSNKMKIVVIILAGWIIVVSGSFGYTLLNDADFLATLPQFENADPYGLSADWKNQFFPTLSTGPGVSYLQTNNLSFCFFSGTRFPENLNPILRC